MQRKLNPFTEHDYFRALCLVMPEPEATDLAADTFPHMALPISEGNARGIGWSLDTLVLLAFVSPDLEQRVLELLRRRPVPPRSRLPPSYARPRRLDVRGQYTDIRAQ